MTAPARMNGARFGLSGSERSQFLEWRAGERRRPDPRPPRRSVSGRPLRSRGSAPGRDRAAASDMIVPATPIARLGWRSSGSAARTPRPSRARSSPNCSVSRTEPTSMLTARSARTSSVEPPPMSTTMTPSSSRGRRSRREGEPRLLLAGQQPRREAVAPLDLAEEGLAVLGVADGARRDAEDALGAELLDPRRYPERTFRTRAMGRGRSRRRASTPSPSEVISLAPLERVDRSVAHVGNEQPGGVRPEIDGRNTHGAIIAAATRGGAVR